MARIANIAAYKLLLVDILREGIKTGYKKEPIITCSMCRKHGVNYKVGSYSFKALVKYGVFHKRHEDGSYYFGSKKDFSIGNPGIAEEIYNLAKEMYYSAHPYTPVEKSNNKNLVSLKDATLDEIFEEMNRRGYKIFVTK